MCIRDSCILDTDASDVAVGAVLSQVVGGVERPIAFFSRVLNSTQRNYCPTRRELLAVIVSLQRFRHYLPGAHAARHLEKFGEIAPHSPRVIRVHIPNFKQNLEFWLSPKNSLGAPQF